MVEGNVEFDGQNNGDRHQQSNACRRKVSYRASDKGVLFKQDDPS
jgi:hypothetical protein